MLTVNLLLSKHIFVLLGVVPNTYTIYLLLRGNKT